jgi:aspartate/methionine/tyrosine aminotransferase
MRFANRMSRLGTETAFEVLAKAKALEAKGRKIIHLEIGEPDFDTPSNIVEAGIRALRDGFTHYGPAAGIPELRQAIAENHLRWRGVEVSPDQVVVTPGAKPIMFFVMLALLEEGDEVLYPNPGFPIYESVIRYLGAKPIPIRPREEKAFGVDVDEIRQAINDRTKLVILNYPQNPTGGSISDDDLAAIASLLAEREIPTLVDEVYKDIVYEGKFRSLLSFPGMDRCGILLDGFSKSYAMTGWRLGYGVLPLELAKKVTQLAINCNSCTATFTQKAGIEALQGPQDEVKRMVAEFRKRRDAIVEGLNAIDGISCPVPRGAFYVFPNIQETGVSSRDLETMFLNEAGVACLSGTSFGAHGDGYLRFSYANSLENIRTALTQIRETLGKK